MLRNALRYTHHKRYFSCDRLFNTCCGYGRRDEDRGGIGTCFFDCFGDGREDRLAEMCLAGFLGVRAAYDIGAVFDRLRCVESALSSGLR